MSHVATTNSVGIGPLLNILGHFYLINVSYNNRRAKDKVALTQGPNPDPMGTPRLIPPRADWYLYG